MLLLLLLFTAPGFAAEPPGYSYKSCERADLNRSTIPFTKEGVFRPECAPDTLYSWGSREKVNKLAADSTPENVLPAAWLYTWRTPIGSFGYGDVGIRIKLRPDVKFKLLRNPLNRICGSAEMNDDNTVYVAYLDWYDFSEFILCGSSAVESWSYGQADFLREMQREKEWVETHSVSEFDAIRHVFDCGSCFMGNGYDGHETTPERLLRNFAAIKRVIEDKEGKIFYAKGVEASVDRHFRTGVPSYFNGGKRESPASTEEGEEPIWLGAPL